MYGTVIALVLAAVACAILYRLANPPRRRRSLRVLRADLRAMTHDDQVAENLIERMRRRHPGASDIVLVKLAIAELRADRRH